MSTKSARLLVTACAGAALLSASPAAAETVVMYFNDGHFLVGYIVYGNDGHVCEQSGFVTSFASTYQVDSDC